MTTVAMQKLVVRRLKITAEATMDVAEKLYQSGYISYPRTETDQFDTKADLRALISQQVSDPRWGTYAQRLLDGGFRQPRSGKHNDGAHPPIHPVRPGTELSGTESAVYEIIARH